MCVASEVRLRSFQPAVSVATGLGPVAGDDLSADVRRVDSAGSTSSTGLAQVRTALGFGTICGMNLGAADVFCRQVGFDFGSVANCGKYGGSNMWRAWFPNVHEGFGVHRSRLECAGLRLVDSR